MLRIRKRYDVFENNTEENIHRQRSDEDSTNVFMSQKQTSSSMNRTSLNPTEHSATETRIRSHKKKKRLRNRNVSSSDESDDNANGSADTKSGILVAAKKAEIRNSPVVQLAENVRQTQSKKKLCSADDSGRKKRKREFDFLSDKIQASVLHQKSESDSTGERTGSGKDSLATSSKSSLCDLQDFEDSAVGDYVSMHIINLCGLMYLFITDVDKMI